MRGPSEHSPGAKDPLYESLLWCLGGLGQLLQPWTFDFSSDLLTYLRDAERTSDFCKALWGAEVLSRLSVLTAFMQLSWVLSLSWESQPPAGQQERLVYTELCQWFLKRHTVTSREVCVCTHEHTILKGFWDVKPHSVEVLKMGEEW